MDFIVEEFRGKELDPIIKQVSEEFLAYDSFFKTRSFLKFVWRKNIEQFKAICEKRKNECPHKDISAVEVDVKQEILT